MKKTKMICSIGPASNNYPTFLSMVKAGLNVARVNFSHATSEERLIVEELVKRVNEEENYNVGLLFDTKGPEFRSGMVENGEIILEAGKTIRIVKDEVVGNLERISVNHPKAIDSLKVGDTVLLVNGLIKLEVISKETDGVTCKIFNGGVLGNHKSMAAPGVKLDIPFISEDDYNDITYACQHDGDFLALSFVSTKEDVLEARKILEENNRTDMKIISKIESLTGIENLDEIIEVSDGIMVARGDLGVEAPVAMLPIYQKQIIEKCRKHGKFVIVATEMLVSMKHSIRPTRAEASDVANAVFNQTDAVMLSDETTIGEYPVETVKTMASIVENAENYLDYDHQIKPEHMNNIGSAIATAAVEAAKATNSKLIFAATMKGSSAIRVSSLRSDKIVLAGCPTKEVARKLALNFGVYSVMLPVCNSTDEVITKSKALASEFTNLEKGDTMVITGGFPNNEVEKTTNLLKIEII